MSQKSFSKTINGTYVQEQINTNLIEICLNKNSHYEINLSKQRFLRKLTIDGAMSSTCRIIGSSISLDTLIIKNVVPIFIEMEKTVFIPLDNFPALKVLQICQKDFTNLCFIPGEQNYLETLILENIFANSGDFDLCDFKNLVNLEISFTDKIHDCFFLSFEKINLKTINLTNVNPIYLGTNKNQVTKIAMNYYFDSNVSVDLSKFENLVQLWLTGDENLANYCTVNIPQNHPLKCLLLDNVVPTGRFSEKMFSVRDLVFNPNYKLMTFKDHLGIYVSRGLSISMRKDLFNMISFQRDIDTFVPLPGEKNLDLNDYFDRIGNLSEKPESDRSYYYTNLADEFNISISGNVSSYTKKSGRYGIIPHGQIGKVIFHIFGNCDTKDWSVILNSKNHLNLVLHAYSAVLDGTMRFNLLEIKRNNTTIFFENVESFLDANRIVIGDEVTNFQFSYRYNQQNRQIGKIQFVDTRGKKIQILGEGIFLSNDYYNLKMTRQ